MVERERDRCCWWIFISFSICVPLFHPYHFFGCIKNNEHLFSPYSWINQLLKLTLLLLFLQFWNILFLDCLYLPTYLPYLLIFNHGPNIQCMIIFVLVEFVCLLLVVYTNTVVGFMWHIKIIRCQMCIFAVVACCFTSSIVSDSNLFERVPFLFFLLLFLTTGMGFKDRPLLFLYDG